VDLMSRWPIQLCNVRMSTPCRKCSVARVWRNLWRKKCRQYGPWAHLLSVFGHTLSAVQFGALGHALDDHVIFTVGITF
jgi:hypothetical protein